MHNFGLRFLSLLSLPVVAFLAGCSTPTVSSDDGESVGGSSFSRVSSRTYSLRNDAFELTCQEEQDGSFRITSITNLRENVTTIDLQRFGVDLYSLVVHPRIKSTRTITPGDEAMLYLSFDMCVESINDLTTFACRSMRPASDYNDVPDDFDDAPLFLDVKMVGDTSAKRSLTADARDQLVPIRKLCARNLALSECGRKLQDYGANFWGIPKEVFAYQYESVIGGIRRHPEKRYLQPNFGNLWGVLRTNDPELSAYSIGVDIVDEKKQADRSLARIFADYWDMLVKVEKALDGIDNAVAKDILHDVVDEFGQKDKELRGNIDVVMIDIPLSIYAKIAIHEIDQAKGLLNDREDKMIQAMARFSTRTEKGRLIGKARSESTKNVCRQLINLARGELNSREFKQMNDEYFEGVL